MTVISNGLRSGFVEFLHNLPFYGLAVCALTTRALVDVLAQVGRSVVTYGVDSDADVRAENIKSFAAA